MIGSVNNRQHRPHYPIWRVVSALAVLACLTLGSRSASAEIQSARASALSGAYNGGGTGNGALYHNPAGMIATYLYSAELGYRFDAAQSLSSFGLSIVDSKTNRSLSGGVSYAYSFADEDADEGVPSIANHDIRVGLAGPLGTNRVSMGIAGHYLRHQIGDDSATGFTLDTGVMALVVDNLSLGLSGNNLVKVDGLELDRLLNVGAAVFVGPAMLTAEIGTRLGSDVDRTPIFRSGAEVTIAQMIPIRVGFRSDPAADNRQLSAGLGFRSEAFGFDGLFAQSLEDAESRSFGVTLSIYL